MSKQLSGQMSAQEFKTRFPHASASTIARNVSPAALMHPEDKNDSRAILDRKKRQMNKTEAEFLLILKESEPNAQIVYEKYTLKLAPDLRYTPDFAVIEMFEGTIDFYEVKGPYIWPRMLNKPKAAAQLYPWHAFYLAQKVNGQWKIDQIKRDE
jgi:hypothetical protein